ncbi:uncharacterized protein LOC114352285 [Ostrinia furnacalis]|uniref:uncharacterized protein LOC114352285 n=1 Tax=Ostrinia furnacalis TaxID=93504 RepID=UPI00103EA259|nr:uncharacterized protein LOC114352285 [Ostrinia furnacalis]
MLVAVTPQVMLHGDVDRVHGMMLMIVSLLVAQGNFGRGVKPVPNKTIKLVEKIRRQLMEDNYDYLPTEEDLFPPAHHYDHDVPNDPLYVDNDTLAGSAERQARPHLFKPRAKESKEESKKFDHVVSKNDLLYYMDDDRLREAALNTLEDVSGDLKASNDTGPKTKYKVLKVKSLHPNRRSLSQGRFIQEESPAGVALISLDGRPFPDFHLPRSRRQYMPARDSADLSEDSGENNTLFGFR